jgi:hypothetical protein
VVTEEEELRAQVTGLGIGVLEALVKGLRTKDLTKTYTLGQFVEYLDLCIGDLKALHPEAKQP